MNSFATPGRLTQAGPQAPAGYTAWHRRGDLDPAWTPLALVARFRRHEHVVYATSTGKDPRHTYARRIYEVLLAEDRLCLSTQVLQELCVTLAQKASVLACLALVILGRWTRSPDYIHSPVECQKEGPWMEATWPVLYTSVP